MHRCALFSPSIGWVESFRVSQITTRRDSKKKKIRKPNCLALLLSGVPREANLRTIHMLREILVYGPKIHGHIT